MKINVDYIRTPLFFIVVKSDDSIRTEIRRRKANYNNAVFSGKKLRYPTQEQRDASRGNY